MTTFTNITNRAQFDKMLDMLKKATTIVVDTETNGLKYYREHHIISISIYLPEFDAAYNYAFAHGFGQVADAPPIETFHDMNWAGKDKKRTYLQYWYSRFIENNPNYHQNMPIEWLEDLKALWGRDGLTHIYHNAPFDLHMLEAQGFPRPASVEDTMVLLHVVHENWSGVEVVAPFTWSGADRKNGKCSKDDVDQWARDEDGVLMKRKQFGNRKLKWQCAFLDIPDATVGEEQLFAAKKRFEGVLVNYIMDNLHDPMNDDLVYASIRNAQGNQKKYEKAWENYYAQQYTRIQAKVELDSKADMWMLPSGETAYYAMLDVVLTWKLRETWLPVVKQWDNLDLYYQQCEVQYRVAWQMERNGVLLDVERCEQEIANLDPKVEAIQVAFNQISHMIGYGQPVNIGSWQQLLAFLQWRNAAGMSVLEMPMDKTVFPDFYMDDEDRISGLRAYEKPTVPDTSHDTLEQYEDHPVIKLVFAYRKMKKSSDTYLKNWLKARDSEGYVHGGMNSTGTVSGRWSSGGEAGNWQNIPDRNGYTIKRSIIEPENWRLFAIDYGQLEARLAAWIAESLLRDIGVHDLEPTMINLFNQGVDMHAYTRDMIDVRNIVFGGMSDLEIMLKLGYDDKGAEANAKIVAKTCRQIAKTLNFGLLYDGTEYMASKLLKIPLDIAKVLVVKWRNLFPAFALAQDYYTNLALTWRENPSGDGFGMYVTQPISNRHRKLHKYSKWAWFYDKGVRKGFNPQEASAKKTWNNVVQGLAGYICTTSGLYISQKYGTDKLRLFANIHDALDGYVHVDHMHIIEDLRTIMTNWDTNPILTTDLEGSIDGTWQGMTHVEDYDKWVQSKGRDGYTH